MKNYTEPRALLKYQIAVKTSFIEHPVNVRRIRRAMAEAQIYGYTKHTLNQYYEKAKIDALVDTLADFKETNLKQPQKQKRKSLLIVRIFKKIYKELNFWADSY